MQFPAKLYLEVFGEAELRGNINRAKKITAFHKKRKRVPIKNREQERERERESKASICVKLPGKRKAYNRSEIGFFVSKIIAVFACC